MKRAFVRALWGIYDESHRVLKRRYGIDGDIQNIQSNSFNQPFITYVFGEDNLKKLKDNGIENCILLNKEPFMYNGRKTHIYGLTNLGADLVKFYKRFERITSVQSPQQKIIEIENNK